MLDSLCLTATKFSLWLSESPLIRCSAYLHRHCMDHGLHYTFWFGPKSTFLYVCATPVKPKFDLAIYFLPFSIFLVSILFVEIYFVRICEIHLG